MVSRVGVLVRQGGCARGCGAKNSRSTVYPLHRCPRLAWSQDRSLESRSRNLCLHGPSSDSASKGPLHEMWQMVADVSTCKIHSDFMSVPTHHCTHLAVTSRTLRSPCLTPSSWLSKMSWTSAFPVLTFHEPNLSKGQQCLPDSLLNLSYLRCQLFLLKPKVWNQWQRSHYWAKRL